MCVYAQSLSHVCLCVTPGTVAHQATLSMGNPRQDYWNALPFLLQESTRDPHLILKQHLCFFSIRTNTPSTTTYQQYRKGRLLFASPHLYFISLGYIRMICFSKVCFRILNVLGWILVCYSPPKLLTQTFL